jgi:alpha-glucosidase (family GH31 glycosyl hydrolase)
MQRRTFLRSSAIGIGTFAKMCTGGLTLEASSRNPSPVTAQSKVAMGDGKQLAWGINALFLKSPWSDVPSVDDLLADQEHTLLLNSFYRAGGENRPATPTELRIAYNNETLLVGFRCEESEMSFPAINQEADWYALDGSPSGSEVSASVSSPPFPDEVDFFIQPDMNAPFCYQFAATLSGLQFGCERLLTFSLEEGESSYDQEASASLAKVDAFEARVIRRANEWIGFFQIPWKTLGGKPKSHFGLLPVRTRWRNGEFSSPAAIDFVERMPVDLFIEAHFAGKAVEQSQTSLCRLPSGLLRWQRPVMLLHADTEMLQQIWKMESSLTLPTDANSFAQRLHLTQRWVDLLALEGFNFLPDTGTIVKEDMTPSVLRRNINITLRENDLPRAYQLLDIYLDKLDKASRHWFADGSPGNILEEEWKSVTSVDSLEVKDSTLLMQGLAGGHRVDLHLALPKAGGVRIFGKDEGYFKPADLLPLEITKSSTSWAIKTADGVIVVNWKPFSISFYNAARNEVTQIGANRLAFRFSPDGKILATDLRNQLDPTEVIYGFGERYDRFDQNGNILTLWAMDDWIGCGSGLRNETYKALPIFHSSKGYMAFANSSYRLRADIGGMVPDEYRLTQQGPIFDYYFWIGPPEKALQSYTALTGRPILPPKWAFEPWIGRGEGAWKMGQLHNAVAEEERVVKQWEALDIPHTAIYAEGPSASSPALHEFMAAREIKVLGYFWPEVRQARQELLLPRVKVDELPILQSGNEKTTRELGYVDFTHPNALELARQWWKRDLELGVAGSMVDYGDRVPEDAVFYNGKRGAEVHNFYYYDYHRTISEVFQEKRGNDFILYARGAAPGTQKWLGQFAGDHPSNFDGLKAVLTGALNLCACGFSTWGSDLGGYFGWPEPAVFMRWTQFATFSPLMRPHGKAPRDPWYYGEAAVANYQFCAWVRRNLLNYIYLAAVVAHESGIPIMRSMAVAFPDERQLAAVKDQYMFGEDLLIAPVINEHDSRAILFPSGLWTSLWDGKTVSGPANPKTTVPLDKIPVYLRPGAVVPVQLNQELQFGKSMTVNSVTVLVVTPPNGDETVSRLNAQGKTAKVTVQSTAHGFGWTLENFPEMNYLLVYGTTTATAVRVDGKALPKKMATRVDLTPTSWEADTDGNRLIVHLPSVQARPNGPTIKIEVDFKS